MSKRGAMHLLIGPVGAGKTTCARRRLAREPALFLDLDAWMVRLYGADQRPPDDVMAWYLERRDRCRELVWDVATSALESGSDVVLEIGLLGARERQAFYERVRGADIELRVYLIDAPREVRRVRVAERNDSGEPHVQLVPPEMFELASDAWEPVSEAERSSWGIIDA